MVTAEMKHIEEFYEAHPEVEPKGRWPSLLNAGNSRIYRMLEMTFDDLTNAGKHVTTYI